jgi:glucosamine-6-phosphate deaminase
VDIRVFETTDHVATAVAGRIADAVAARPEIVLGLATGRTPVAAYEELRRLHRTGNVNFARVTTFNVDEFAGIPPDHPGSFRTFMERHLFSGINLAPARIHFLNGAAADLDAECARYERAIDVAGGIGLQLLGIGSNGHIGFNEPGTELMTHTHRVRLADSTRRDNAALFGGDASQVPAEAVSMGVGTILGARTLVLVATGERKAQCIQGAVRGPLTTHLPASFLQLHGNVELYLDRPAASRL